MGERGPADGIGEGWLAFPARASRIRTAWDSPRIAALVACSCLLAALACLGPGTPERSGDPLTPVSADRLAPFVARASAARGLPFQDPVRAFLLQPDQVRQRLDREMRRVIDPAVWDAQVELRRAVGILPPESDPWEELGRLQAGSVVGYYAALDDRLYVVARDAASLDTALGDPFTGGILVHELAHALQAGHSALLELSLGLEESDDLGFALSALLEGDALWTELRDAGAMGGGPLPTGPAFAERFEADVAAGMPEVSAWLRAMFLEPYPRGYAWVRHRFDADGRAGLDRALRRPPMSSAAILHPERALEGRWEFDDVALAGAMPAPCQLGATNALGELGLRIWSGDPGLPRQAGWRADRAWHYRCGPESRWAWVLAFESAAHAAQFEPAFRARATGLAGSQVHVRGERLLIERGLGPDAIERLLEQATLQHFESLDAWLAAHPRVSRRIEQVRRAASAIP